MRTPSALPFALVLGLATLLAAERPARACGGCLAPPATMTTVGSHRMVVSLSPERSVLWDQIQYTGDPEDFAWVLPVPSPAVDVEIADAAFFDELDAWTAPRVIPEASMPPCFGCCAGGGLAGPAAEPEVVVYEQDVVGPYEMVVIGAEDPDALQRWLDDNGYRLPESARPVIGRYVARGSAFVALRLAPEQGVRSMQPVRVTFAGYLGTFPLEMVTVGAQGRVELSLWVIAEQRYEAGNYANAVVDADELVYDWSSSSANYDQVFAATLDAAGGRAWITEYAGPLAGIPIASSELAQVHDDLSAPYVTRLRTDMLVAHLDEDLRLVPAADPGDVGRDLVPGDEIGGADDGCQLGGGGGGHALLLLALVGLTGHLARRRGRR